MADLDAVAAVPSRQKAHPLQSNSVKYRVEKSVKSGSTEPNHPC